MAGTVPQLEILELRLSERDRPNTFNLGTILLQVVNPKRSVLKHIYLSGITEGLYDKYNLSDASKSLTELVKYEAKTEWVDSNIFGPGSDWLKDATF